MSAITVKNLNFSYENADESCVRNVSFSIEENSYTAIVGVNGSGKSTVAKIIAGILEPSSGSVEISSGLRVGIVFQSPKDQIICGIVSRDTAFGPENLKLPPSEVESLVIENLAATGILELYNKKSMCLSLGQTQKLALSGILAMSPDILILDESVSMLDPSSREDIFNFLDAYRRKNKTILHITHDIDAVFRAENVILMNKSVIEWQGSRDDFFSESNKALKEIVTGKPLTKRNCNIEENEIALAVKNISFSYGNNKVFENLNFVLKKGTVTAIAGPSGSGKSTLLEILSGLLKPSSGVVLATERPVISLQNSDSALFEQFAADDVAFGAKNRGIKGKKLVEIVKKSMEKVNLPFEKFASRQTMSLSGGEKKRLALAGILALDSDILLFDEPSCGLDGNSRNVIVDLMKNLADEGKTILFSTHYHYEVDFADEVLVLENGKLTGKSTYFNEDFSEKLKVQPPLSGVSFLEKISNYSASIEIQKNERKSVIEKMPSMLKTFVFLLLFCSILGVKNVCLCGSLFLTGVLYALLAKFPLKKLLFTMLKIIPFLSLFFIFQFVFAPLQKNDSIYLNYRFFSVSYSKIIFCVQTLLRTEGALALILGFVHSSDDSDVLNAFKIFPRSVVVLVEIIFRFIPLLLDETCSIVKTQLIRGGLGNAKGFFGKIKAVIPLIIPLIIQTIKRAGILAEALTARGF